MKAKEVMLSRDEIKDIGPDERIATAKLVMSRNNIGGLPVTDSENKVIGFLTMRDLNIPPVPSNLFVRELMSKDLVTASPETNLKEIAKKMLETGIQRIPVVDNDGKLKGLITQTSMIEVLSNLL